VLNRCDESNFRFYVYSLADVFGVGELVNTSTKNTSFVQTLHESPYYTVFPALACVYIVPFAGNRIIPDQLSHLPPKLQALPYWKSGENHVIMDSVDAKCWWGDVDIGKAALWVKVAYLLLKRKDARASLGL
jgi:hypothetical protein